MNEELDSLIEKLDTLDNRVAWGRIIGHLIRATVSNTQKTGDLIESLERASNETNRIYAGIMRLTFFVALAAVVQVVLALPALWSAISSVVQFAASAAAAQLP